jgi:UDP-N-acetylglucosamine 4-epimerase
MTDWRQLHADQFDGQTVLVTGGAGFIGGHLTDALLALGASVVVLDDLCGSTAANLEAAANEAGDRLRIVEGSILDVETLNRCTAGCRYVFHLAALGSVPRSVEEPVLYMQVNIEGTSNVLEAARAARVQRVIYSASSSAYGDSEQLPKIESMPVQPKSPYAASKVAGEALMRAYAGCYELDTLSLRYFNIFGPRQNANSAYAAVIAAFAKALAAGQRPVIYGDGEQSRDFTYVDNAVHANLLGALTEGPTDGEVLNVACGERVSVNALALMMARTYGRADLQPLHEDVRAGDVMHSLADLTLVQTAIGYEPIVSFADGLASTVAWYRHALGKHG